MPLFFPILIYTFVPSALIQWLVVGFQKIGSPSWVSKNSNPGGGLDGLSAVLP